MKLTFEADTIEDLMNQVCKVANKFNVDLSENTKTPITEEVVKAAEVSHVEVVKEEKPKRSTKKDKKEDVEAVVVETAEVKNDATVVYTKDNVTEICQKVSEKLGLEKAREILAKFNSAKGEPVKRISEVQESDYAALITKCEQELA